MPKEPKGLISFDEWLKNNPDIEDLEGEVDCDKCDGDREIECSECGHMRDCPKCGGSGKRKTRLASKIYKECVDRDLALWKEYAEQITKAA